MMTTASYKFLIFYFQVARLWDQILSNFKSKVYLQLQNPVISLITIEKCNWLNYKQQLKFANNFCCVIVVVIYLTSHYFIKALFLMLMQGVGKGLILFTSYTQCQPNILKSSRIIVARVAKFE